MVSLMLRRSLPAMSGEFMIAQSEKCERSWASVMPLPTSIMSMSFQWPGPANLRSFSCLSRIGNTPQDDQEPWLSSQSQQG